jgi:hypothetical protein
MGASLLAKVVLTGLYLFLIFWALQAAYVLWLAYRNNALPSFRQSHTRSRGLIIGRNIREGRAHSERV